MLHMSPQELQARLAAGPPPVLLDCREPWEHELARLPGSVLIPVGELPHRWGELDPTRETVVYCHHGIRSLGAARFLHEAGFAAVRSLDGGIDAWARHIDPSVGSY